MKYKLSRFTKRFADSSYGISDRLKDFIYSKGLLWLAKGLALLIFVSLRYVLSYRRAIINMNLTTSFPKKSTAEIRKLMATYYRHMSDLAIEPFLFYLAPRILRERLVTYTNLEVLNKLYHDHKQVIVFASHYGNWEYLTNLPQVTDYQVYSAYSPIKNRMLNRLMMGIRSFMGVRLIPRKLFYRKALLLMREHSAPKLLVIIADQRPAPGSAKYHLPFLEQDTAVQTGGERIAASSHATMVYVEVKKKARFKYDFTFMTMENANPIVPLSITKAYYCFLERSIYLAPSYWLWSHNRWKVSPATPTNPS